MAEQQPKAKRSKTQAGNSKLGKAVVNLTKANLEFAMGLNYHLVQQGMTNTFFSPACINIALAMIRLGAEKKTRHELTKVLNLDLMDSEAEVADSYGWLMETLNQVATEKHKFLIRSINGENKYEQDPNFDALHTATKMFVQDWFPIQAKFMRETMDIFKSEVGVVDFESNPEKAAMTINKWVDKVTNSKIQDVVDPEKLKEPYLSIILISSIYFKGTWEEEFETSSGTFNCSSSRVVRTDSLSLCDRFDYAKISRLDCKVLAIPYRNFGLEMVIMLPNKVNGLDEMMRKLNPDDIGKLDKSWKMQQVDVTLPKFRLETDYDLKDVLRKMGVDRLFSQKDAELKGISTYYKEFYVSALTHKTFVEVTERGTEAAAICCGRLCGGGRPPPEFKADHPFLFFIRQRKTGMVLFMGCLRDPTVK